MWLLGCCECFFAQSVNIVVIRALLGGCLCVLAGC